MESDKNNPHIPKEVEEEGKESQSLKLGSQFFEMIMFRGRFFSKMGSKDDF